MQSDRPSTRSQYRDSSNLNARQQLHARFSVNQHGWHRWVFDQLVVPFAARIVELGCGPGALWVENLNRVPLDWRVTLVDLSPGMLYEARAHCPDTDLTLADAQSIPFDDGSFDAVIANHMLYHLPERQRALAEMRRILPPGGRLYAATNGDCHMRELSQLMAGFGAALPSSHRSFSIENGESQLRQFFSEVTFCRYDDALVVTEAEPLVAYARSTQRMTDEGIKALSRRVEDELSVSGSIHIAKDVGLFQAH